MRQYHHIKKTEEIKEISKMICNQCGKEIPVVNGQAREGVFSADYSWGYFSEKDGEVHHWDLCESCYDNLLNQFRIEADVEEQVEFI